MVREVRTSIFMYCVSCAYICMSCFFSYAPAHTQVKGHHYGSCGTDFHVSLYVCRSARDAILRSCTFLGVRAHSHRTVPPCRRAFGSRNLPILVLPPILALSLLYLGTNKKVKGLHTSPSPIHVLYFCVCMYMSSAMYCISVFVYVCLHMYVLCFYMHVFKSNDVIMVDEVQTSICTYRFIYTILYYTILYYAIRNLLLIPYTCYTNLYTV